ncbi:MAG TPA: chemotaxis protein CheW [Lysobacter sp.]
MNSPAIDAYLDELLELAVEPVPATPAAANAPSIEPAPVPIAVSAGLLAELESDPLFAQADAEVVPTPSAVSAGLLAELDSDPLFTQAETEIVPAPSAMPAGLLAELDSDPLFAQADAAPPLAAAPVPPTTIPAPKPASARAAAIAASGLRPVEFTPPALPPSVTDTHRWLRVAVGDDSYALELLRVQEVGRTSPIVAMRGAATSVLGVMNLRGRIVPVFDLGLWLGTGRVCPDERARIVVVERDNELIGALVSAVDDVVTLGPDRIEPPLMASPSRAIVGVARVVAKPTVLLDANALFG